MRWQDDPLLIRGIKIVATVLSAAAIVGILAGCDPPEPAGIEEAFGRIQDIDVNGARCVVWQSSGGYAGGIDCDFTEAPGWVTP